MVLNYESLKDKTFWENAGVLLPGYDAKAVSAKTKASPEWLHFGAGNIFRAYPAALQQTLLNGGNADTGIIAAEMFDGEIIDKIYTPYDNLVLNVTLNQDSTTRREITASVAEALKPDINVPESFERLYSIAEKQSLRLITYTVTEKGYCLTASDGEYLPQIKADMASGKASGHVMSVTAYLLLRRYKAGGYPVAVVSLDNCSHNGDKLREAVTEISRAWRDCDRADDGFIRWLEDEKNVSFPLSMIDKITPRPAGEVRDMLEKSGISGMEAVVTAKGTYIAPFANAERPEYLVIEDKFPNGRPKLELAGVYFTNRDTVNKAERMKVTACLNPLHTAMSVYGCLLGYRFVNELMTDPDITELIKRLGYDEGLKVADSPGILSPKAFIDEVINERLPNPFMRDQLLRITTDTSQKVGIRFGETIKSYINKSLDLNTLISIPLAIAGWLRYLLAVDDNGQKIEVSPDPLKDELQAKLSGIIWNKPESYGNQLAGILNNPVIFGTDLTKTGLAGKIEGFFKEELAGAGAVRNVLRKYLS